MRARLIIPIALVLILIGAVVPQQSVPELLIPKRVTTNTETFYFDVTVDHESRKDLHGTQPKLILQTNSISWPQPDSVYCAFIKGMYSDWDCEDKANNGAGSLWNGHYLEYEDYTLEAYVLYMYKVRHHGSVTIQFRTVQSGTSSPVTTSTIQSSVESFDTEVKASLHVEITRKYRPMNYIRNTFEFDVPFPVYGNDLDGSGNFVNLGNLKIWLWDEYVPLSWVNSTNGLGSMENLSGSVNLVQVDLLDLGAKWLQKYGGSNPYASSLALGLKAANYLVEVNFELDLDLQLDAQAAVQPFLGTGSAYSISSQFNSHVDRVAYGCLMGFQDVISSDSFNLSSTCTHYLTAGSSEATVVLGTWYSFSSAESYSTHIRINPASNTIAGVVWNLFTNQPYIDIPISSGHYSSSTQSMTSAITSSSSTFSIPAPTSAPPPNDSPVPVVTVTPTVTSVGYVVTANTLQTNDAQNDPIQVSVSWGDGETTGWVAKGEHTHTYNSAGTYSISVRAKDNQETSESIHRTVIIQELQTSQSAQLLANRTTIVEGEQVTFTFGSYGTTGTLNYFIDYGDGTNGSFSSSQSVSHTYSTQGIQYVVLYVYNSNYSTWLYDSVQIEVDRNTSSAGLNSNTFSITGNKILIVIDDDNESLYAVESSYYNGSDEVNPYTSQSAIFEALNTVAQITGYDWDIYIVGDTTGDNIWDTSNVTGPGLGMLQDYKLVIWTTGYDWYPFTSDDEDNLDIFVNAGGRLVLFSQDYLYGACWDCETWSNGSFANSTLGVGTSWQDGGMGSILSAESGHGMYNIGYLPLAGLDYMVTRNVTADFASNVSYQDSVFIVAGDSFSIPLINSSLPSNGTEVSHGIAKMHFGSVWSRTAFLAFDPVQLRYRYDLETMMLGLFDWALDSWNDKSNVSNANFIPIGIEGTSIIGPGTYDTLPHAAGLVDWHKVRIPAGRTYTMAFASTYDYSSSYTGCTNGPLIDVALYDEYGSNRLAQFNCDSVTKEWSMNVTPSQTTVYSIRVETYDYNTSSDSWLYWYHVNLTEQSDPVDWLDCWLGSGGYTLIPDGAPISDVIQPYTGSSNIEDYSSSCFELDVVAGTSYAVTLLLNEDVREGVYIYTSGSTYNLTGDTIDLADGSQQRAELAFTANQNTTITIETGMNNYSHPLLAKGAYTIQAWTLPTTHPVDDYLNASSAIPSNSTPSGWVDAEMDGADWWVIPVTPDEPVSIGVTVDREGEFGILVYWTPSGDPANWTLVGNRSTNGNTTFNLPRMAHGDLRIGMVALWGRTNYTIEISEQDDSPDLTLRELHFGEIGFIDNQDSWSMELSAGTPLVVRGNATPSFYVGQNSANQLTLTLTTPSGSVFSANTSGASTNLTLSHYTTEDGTYTITVNGSGGGYWLWPIIDDEFEMVSYPQRYATAEVLFTDSVSADQSIISDRYGHYLVTYQTYSLSQGPSGMALDSITGNVSFTPTRQQVGTHSVSVMVSNGWGNIIWSNYSIIVSELPNSAPVLTNLGSLTASLGSQMNIQLQATDVDNDTLSFSILTGPVGASINTASGQITWLPSSAGPVSFEVLVEDEHGLSHNLSFVVIATNEAPVPNSPNSEQVTVAQSYSNSLTSTDTEGHSTIWGLRFGPTGLSISTSGVVSWTPIATQIGNHTVIAEVADSYGETAVVWWTIEVLNTAPSVSTIEDASLYPGQLLDVNLSMTDNDGHSLWATLVSGPSGLSVDEGGRILWIPSPDQIGTHVVELLVVDSFGSTSTVSFSVEVLNNDPVLVELQRWQDLRFETIWVLFEAADADGHTTSFDCASQEVTKTVVGINTHLIEWKASSTLDALSLTCSTNDGYGGQASLPVNLAFLIPDLSISVVSNETFEFGEPISATLQTGLDLVDVQVQSLAHGSATVVNESGDWTIFYHPADNESGPITVLVTVTSDIGDELQAVWSFSRVPENLSWSCQVSDVIEEGPGALAIWINCDRPDVSITAETISGQVDIDSTPIFWSGLDYGNHSLVLFFTGPDGTSVTELVEWYHPSPVASGELHDITLNATVGELLSIDLIWQTENIAASYCRASDSNANLSVSVDCRITYVPSVAGVDTFSIELMDGDVLLDEASVTLYVREPEPEKYSESDEDTPFGVFLPLSGGILLGILILGSLLFIMKMVRTEDEDISTEKIHHTSQSATGVTRTTSQPEELSPPPIGKSTVLPAKAPIQSEVAAEAPPPLPLGAKPVEQPVEATPGKTWTDERGYSWRSMSDGRTQMWNGSDWQDSR